MSVKVLLQQCDLPLTIYIYLDGCETVSKKYYVEKRLLKMF